MRLDPMVLIQLTNNHGERLVRVDCIEVIEARVVGDDSRGSYIHTTSGHCAVVNESPDEVRLKLVEAYALAAEALS